MCCRLYYTAKAVPTSGAPSLDCWKQQSRESAENRWRVKFALSLFSLQIHQIYRILCLTKLIICLICSIRSDIEICLGPDGFSARSAIFCRYWTCSFSGSLQNAALSAFEGRGPIHGDGLSRIKTMYWAEVICHFCLPLNVRVFFWTRIITN